VRYHLLRDGTGKIMGETKLKNYLTIDRRDEGSCYVIYCQKCETITYAVSARGYMYYKEATRLARKHRCD
jgi:hypothetical protein